MIKKFWKAATSAFNLWQLMVGGGGGGVQVLLLHQDTILTIPIYNFTISPGTHTFTPISWSSLSLITWSIINSLYKLIYFPPLFFGGGGGWRAYTFHLGRGHNVNFCIFNFILGQIGFSFNIMIALSLRILPVTFHDIHVIWLMMGLY